MSIFKRLRDLTLANIYAMIEKAEDPVVMTDQYLRNMEEDLEEAESALAGQIALEKKFQRLYEEQSALTAKREEQALLAAQEQKTDLARQALVEKREAQQKMQGYKDSYEQNRQASAQLKQQLEEMLRQYHELKNKRDALAARANAAKAQLEINKATAGIGTGSALAGIKRMEEKVLQMEAEAAASAEVRQLKPSLDVSLENLSRDKEIEAELAELMKKVNKDRTP